jgi:hypothetical protein
VNDNPIGDTEPIDWQAAAARQQQHNITLIRAALGDVADLDQQEHQFIAQIASDGGHIELASLLRKARQAPPITPAGQPNGNSTPDPTEAVGHDAIAGSVGSTAGDDPGAAAKEYLTYDGVVVTLGLQVWTNEARQGRITKIADWPGDYGRDDDVWHEVTYPDGRRVHMNRERITTRDVFGAS